MAKALRAQVHRIPRLDLVSVEFYQAPRLARWHDNPSVRRSHSTFQNRESAPAYLMDPRATRKVHAAR